jgi:hypothetical protein
MTMTVKNVIQVNNKNLTIFIFTTRSEKDTNFQGKQLLQVLLSTDNREWYIFGRKHFKKTLQTFDTQRKKKELFKCQKLLENILHLKFSLNMRL